MCRNCDVIHVIPLTHTQPQTQCCESCSIHYSKERENLDLNPKETEYLVLIKTYKNLRKVAVHEEEKSQCEL